MTPAINLVREKGVPHTIYEYEHNPAAASFGLEAAEKLGIEPERVFKTLVVISSGGDYAVCIIPVDRQLDLKLAAKSLGSKKIEMAPPADAERMTGYLLGGVSPLAQKRRLATVIDLSGGEFDEILVSAGRRGLDIGLEPADLAMLTGAVFAPLFRR